MTRKPEVLRADPVYDVVGGLQPDLETGAVVEVVEEAVEVELEILFSVSGLVDGASEGDDVMRGVLAPRVVGEVEGIDGAEV